MTEAEKLKEFLIDIAFYCMMMDNTLPTMTRGLQRIPVLIQLALNGEEIEPLFKNFWAGYFKETTDSG